MDANSNETQPIKDYDGFPKAERTTEPIVSSQQYQSAFPNSAMQNMGIESNDLNSSQNSTMSYRELQRISSDIEKSSRGSTHQHSNVSRVIYVEEAPLLLSPSLTMSHMQCGSDRQDTVKQKQRTRLTRQQVAKAVKLYLEKRKGKKPVMITPNYQNENKATANAFTAQACQHCRASKSNEEVDSAVQIDDGNYDEGTISGSGNTYNLPIVASSNEEVKIITREALRHNSERNQSSIPNDLRVVKFESPSLIQSYRTDLEPTVIIDDGFEDPEVSVSTTRSVNKIGYQTLNNEKSGRKRSKAKRFKKVLHSIFTSIQFCQIFYSQPKRFDTANGVEKVQTGLDESEKLQSCTIVCNNDPSPEFETELGIRVSITVEGPEQNGVTFSQDDQDFLKLQQ